MHDNDNSSIEFTLSATAELVSAPAGTHFWTDIVQHAAESLGLDYAHVARLIPGEGRVETLAVWLDGAQSSNFSYALDGTPCENVVALSRCRVLENVQALYPKDRDLHDLGAEGYIGEPLVSTAGEAIGLIVGITRARLHSTALAQATLRILAARASAELEQRQTMAELRHEHETVHNILHTVEAIIVALDCEGRVTLINRKGGDLLGYEQSELIGRDWFSTCLTPDTDPDVIRRIHRETMSETQSGSEYFESAILTRSGETRLIAWHNSALRGLEDAVIGTLSAGEDITERKATEQALAEERERLQLILDHAPIGIWLQDTRGKLKFVNQAFCDALGIPESRFLAAAHYGELFPPEYLPPCLESDARALVEQGAYVTQERLPFADGRVHDLRIIKYAKRNAQGEPEALVGLSLDISEELRNAAAWRASEARANSILRSAPVGIGVTVGRHFQEVNETFQRMTGYGDAEVIGACASVLYPSEEDYVQVGRVLQQQLRTQSIASLETRWLRKDGTVLDVILSVSPLDPQAPDGARSFTAQDITRQKRVEQALRESEAKFHNLVDWTTDWVYWLMPDGHFSYMTPSVTQITGYDSGEFDACPALLDAIVHPEDRHLWERHRQRHLCEPAQHANAEVDFRIVRKQGDILWVNHSCRPVFDEEGGFQGRRVSVRDITARKEAEEQIRSLAYFDPLTGLPNRRLLLDRLGHALVASNRSGEYGALLMIDLDHFKALNDTQGHDAGDRLLIEVAQRMCGTLREVDTVARLGGDEYVVMLESLGREERVAATEAELVAEKLSRVLNDPYGIDASDQRYFCTPSIGVTLFHGHDASIEELLKQADVALYQAKDAGRNAIRFFSPAMQTAIETRIALETALREALGRDELQLFYQPQTDHAGRWVGAEALLRWRRPGQGLVSPMEFIPLAEETGLILPIGEWVLDQACAQLKAWEAARQTRGLQLAVNVSARQFHQSDFLSTVEGSLSRSGANPARLKLELTESLVLEDVETAIARMRQLKDLGVGFSLDDFGTGYSCLSYLKRLPFDQLKIDQSFVRDVIHDPNDAAIVLAILAMSHSLGLEVVGEGVETEEQRVFLQRNGCNVLQGYLFGRPMPIDEWSALAAAHMDHAPAGARSSAAGVH